jgi:predicted anti-sigma-YlaC factor YlaD
MTMECKCRDVFRYVCDNLDQESDSPECAAIRRHMEGCEDCRAYLASLKQTIAIYRAAVPASAVPEDVHGRLMRALHACMDGPEDPPVSTP